MADVQELSVPEAREASPVPPEDPGGSTVGAAPTVGHEVVFRARDGDAAAFRELYRTYRTDVARLVQRLLGRGTDLDDLVQAVFLQVHRSLRDFRGQSRFSTWLYRVTVYVVLMNRRAARSRPVLVEAPDIASRVAAEDTQRPDEVAALNARLAAFRRLLERLSEKKRTVYVLHELHGVAPAEISEIVGAPVRTVRTRLFYARRDLATLLREEPCLAALADRLGTPELELPPDPSEPNHE